MKELFYLSHEQIARIKRYFPRSHGIPRVDDRRSSPPAWGCFFQESHEVWSSYVFPTRVGVFL